MSEKNKRGGVAVKLLLFGILIVLAFLIGFIILLATQKEELPSDSADNTEETLVESMSMFEKYGNFKSYESAYSVITNYLGIDSSREEIEAEVFLYWFELVKYGDYDDAYSFVDTEELDSYGISYSYEDFKADCNRIYRDSGADETTDMEVMVLDRVSERDLTVGNLHMAVITDGGKDSSVCAYMPFFLTKECKIIPFDVSNVRLVNDRNQAATEGTTIENTPSEALTEDTTENTSSEASTEATTESTTSEASTEATTETGIQ